MRGKDIKNLAHVRVFFIGKVLMKEKTIQKLKVELEESVAQLEQNVKTVQVLEQTIQELKNENTLLSEKVSYVTFLYLYIQQ